MLSRSVSQCSFAAAKSYLRAKAPVAVVAESVAHPKKRHYSATTLRASSSSQKSIFSPDASAWDHVFNGIDDAPPRGSTPRMRPMPTPTGPTGSTSAANQKRTRSQAMTAQEIVAFDHMFDMIFNAIQKDDASKKPAASTGVGAMAKDELDALYGKLRKNSKRMKWTSEEEEVLDRKKEEINLCDTDQQLLDWAMREVFAESQMYTENAHKHMAAMAANKGSSSSTAELPTLQPPTYPNVVALLMRTFRDKYHDPHLALSIFDHAKNLSIPSYVFGCSTLAYNELLQTRWQCFRDLRAVHDALEEMTVNGVEPDRATVRLLDTVRRDVGERHKHSWVEQCEIGSGEAWKLVAKIDAFISRMSAKSPSLMSPEATRISQSPYSKPRLDDWKGSEEEDDSWQFGDWDLPTRRTPQQTRPGAPRRKVSF